eukprot:11228334-Lingulodinium_polyedra.AAC.2
MNKTTKQRQHNIRATVKQTRNRTQPTIATTIAQPPHNARSPLQLQSEDIQTTAGATFKQATTTEQPANNKRTTAKQPQTNRKRPQTTTGAKRTHPQTHT